MNSLVLPVRDPSTEDLLSPLPGRTVVQHCRQLGPEHAAGLQNAVQAAAAALHANYALLSALHSAWLQQLDQHPLRQVIAQGHSCMRTFIFRLILGRCRRSPLKAVDVFAFTMTVMPKGFLSGMTCRRLGSRKCSVRVPLCPALSNWLRQVHALTSVAGCPADA